jgi:single-stranded-DNA-specific exonuclease
MISILGKKWIEKNINKNSIEKVKQDFNLSDILAKIVLDRKYDLNEIHNINNKLEINNVFKNNVDFNNAAEILIESINKKQIIYILGDYDVDGTSATSLLVRFFDYIKQPYFFYIPDRVKDGYGASKKLFRKLLLKEPKLIIMVDCGSTSNEAVEYLNENKIKSIIIDHHEINEPYPNSDAIINPKKNNGYEKYNYFCATALTYFFLDNIIKKTNSDFQLNDYLIYVSLATVCDVMPMRKLNKEITKTAISNFKVKDNFAINTLYKLNNKNNKITVNDLGYFIGPIINSGGRLGKSDYGTKLLTSNNLININIKAKQLIQLNNKRKIIENIILDKIDFKKIFQENKDIIIYFNPSINEGLIGIVAARLKDYFNKPSIVITRSNKLLKGSARSTQNYNIGQVLKSLIKNKIVESGGGHNMAAGFTIKKININRFEEFILKDFKKKNSMSKANINFYYSTISTSAINKDFVNDIYKLDPFGEDNIMPFFFIKNLKIIKFSILKNKHVLAIVKSKMGITYKLICFNCINTKLGEYLISYKKNINVIAQIHENIWNNKKSLQLNIKDIIL